MLDMIKGSHQQVEIIEQFTPNLDGIVNMLTDIKPLIVNNSLKVRISNPIKKLNQKINEKIDQNE